MSICKGDFKIGQGYIKKDIGKPRLKNLDSAEVSTSFSLFNTDAITHLKYFQNSFFMIQKPLQENDEP